MQGQATAAGGKPPPAAPPQRGASSCVKFSRRPLTVPLPSSTRLVSVGIAASCTRLFLFQPIPGGRNVRRCRPLRVHAILEPPRAVANAVLPAYPVHGHADLNGVGTGGAGAYETSNLHTALRIMYTYIWDSFIIVTLQIHSKAISFIKYFFEAEQS